MEKFDPKEVIGKLLKTADGSTEMSLRISRQFLLPTS